jgi:hypothetical protein
MSQLRAVDAAVGEIVERFVRHRNDVIAYEGRPRARRFRST